MTLTNSKGVPITREIINLGGQEWILYEGIGCDKCPYCELPDIERMLCVVCMRWDCPRCHVCEED